MEFLSEYGQFLAKAVTIVISIAVIIGLVVSSGKAQISHDKGHIEVTKLNDALTEMSDTLKAAVLDDNELKVYKKQLQKEHKAAKKSKSKTATEVESDESEIADADEDNSPDTAKKRVFVLNFNGDIHASAVAQLREEITAALSEASHSDEIVVRLESGGGAVHSYGLASSQLDRIRKKAIPLTICVDKVAASGGYMMACVGDKILTAPFAMVGSIGVIGQLPNFNRLLKKHNIDYEQHTAGAFKRSITMFGENTDADREKFCEDLEEIHQHFKTYVGERRQQVDIEAVATGEVWLGSRALELGLVDEIITSDEYLVAQMQDSEVFEIVFAHKKSWQERIGFSVEASFDRVITRWLSRAVGGKFFS